MPGLTAPEPLTDTHDLSDFDCGEPALDDWLKKRAHKNESRFSRTYVICEGRKAVAYVCIAAGSVERGDAPGRLRRNAPDLVPVSIIARLAVARSHAGQGLGSDLLADALCRIALASQTIGMAAVLVHAKNDAARAFYMRCAEFIEFPAESRILFLPMETLLAALSPSGDPD